MSNLPSDVKAYVRRQKNMGVSKSAIARDLGISRSTLYRLESGRSPAGGRAAQNVRNAFLRSGMETRPDEYRGTDLLRAERLDRITWDELEQLSLSGNSKFTRKKAQDKLDEIRGMGISDSEARTMVFDRPRVSRTFSGKKVQWYLGRSKEETTQQSIRNKLRKKGLKVSKRTYTEFGVLSG
tara:strand:+ start:567 stop:1112 length:546 start_codon:yes stop_codon:yes gene_type:complete